MIVHRLERTTLFHKQFKKIKKNPRWQPIFQGSLPFGDDSQSPWHYILNCFLTEQPIPSYFHVHQLSVSNKLKQQIKQRLGKNIKIEILELHFAGHNGDHLLVYHDTPEVTTLIAIGSHSTIFDQL